jgi:hypothetical protein
MSDVLYCTVVFDVCHPIAVWAVWWQALGIISALLVGLAGVWKIVVELRRIAEQRLKESEDRITSAKLKRTEFFLAQHRRLFDDPVLYEVLCLLDEDDKLFQEKEMWDKKRKLLTFLEEIALLVRSGQIRSEVAFYMFGYYARCARSGKNFCVGINLSPEHWGLFFWFVEESKKFSDSNRHGPPELSF